MAKSCPTITRTPSARASVRPCAFVEVIGNACGACVQDGKCIQHTGLAFVRGFVRGASVRDGAAT